MRRAACAVVVAFASLTTACTTTEPADDAVAPVTLPPDPCSSVADSVLSRWGLRAASDPGTGDADGGEHVERSCRMVGRRDGAAVALEIEISSHGGADDSAARAAMTRELEERCAALRAEDRGSFEEQANACSRESPRTDRAGRGGYTDVARALGAYGVVTVTMSHAGPSWRTVPAEVLGISAEFTTRSRDDWP